MYDHSTTQVPIEMDFDKNTYRAIYSGIGGGTLFGMMDHVDDEQVVLANQPIKLFENKMRYMQVSRLTGSFLLRDPASVGFNDYRDVCAVTTEVMPEKTS